MRASNAIIGSLRPCSPDSVQCAGRLGSDMAGSGRVQNNSQSRISVMAAVFSWANGNSDRAHDVRQLVVRYVAVILRTMARYNDDWRFLTQLVECPACSSKNRAFITETPSILARCGKCQATLPKRVSGPFDIDRKKLIYDKNGNPFPPLPLTRGRVVFREIVNFFVRGNFRTAWERRVEREQSVRASESYRAICKDIEENRLWQAENEREERAAAERARRMDEAARERVRQAAERERNLEQAEEERVRLAAEAARRLRQAELEREKVEQSERRRREWMASEAGRLDAQLATVHYMTGREFEVFLGDIFKVKGYEVEVTQASCDHGVDLIVLLRNRKRLAIQAKNQSASVGNSAVQEVYTGMRIYDCDSATVVSNAEYTRAAQEAAQKTGVRLCNLNHLRQFLKDGVWHEL